MVEAGIHQTDIMRYWSDDDIEWVSATYSERPQQLWSTAGDNLIAYSVTYGFSKGAVGNILFTRPARSFFMEEYAYLVETHATIKISEDIAVYHYAKPDWPPEHRPTADEVKHVLSPAPRRNPMGQESTLTMCRTFVESRVRNKPDLEKGLDNVFYKFTRCGAGCHAPHKLQGKRIYLEEFLTAKRFAPHRAKPSTEV